MEISLKQKKNEVAIIILEFYMFQLKYIINKNFIFNQEKFFFFFYKGEEQTAHTHTHIHARTNTYTLILLLLFFSK